MPWWTLLALGFFAAVLVAGSIVGALAISSMKALQAVGLQLNSALEELNAKAEELERRSERAAESVEEAEPHFDHLRTTLDRFSVLTWALGDMAKTVGELRGALLVRK